MRWSAWGAFFCAVAVLAPSAARAQAVAGTVVCVDPSDSLLFCAGYVGHSVAVGLDVFAADRDARHAWSQAMLTLSMCQGIVLLEPCQHAYRRYLCATAFPRCSAASAVQRPCAAVCSEMCLECHLPEVCPCADVVDEASGGACYTVVGLANTTASKVSGGAPSAVPSLALLGLAALASALPLLASARA